MTQKVLKVGSSAAVTIPKKSLVDLGLKIGDHVRLKITKKSVTITPVKAQLSREDEKVLKLTLNFIGRYRKDLEALARQ